MTIIGFNYNKISVEKHTAFKGQVNIVNNVSIKDIIETDLQFGSENKKGIKYIFEFTSKYDPDIATITIGGDIISLEKDDEHKKILEEWKKEEKVSKEVMTRLLNNIMQKCYIEAILLSKEVNLPPPIQLPKVKSEQQK